MRPEELKKLQQTQLEIALEIKRVCQENEIPFFLEGGTFLGAVRHEGFIPWDDDMDIAMLRADYDRFCRIAPEKLGEKYCFQNWHTDSNYPLPFGKVRKRGTVFAEAKSRRLQENGIFVDVFPMDYAPADAGQRKKLAFLLLHLFRVKLMKCRFTPWMEEDRVLWKKRIGYIPYQVASWFVSQKQLVRWYEKLVRGVPAGDAVYEQSALPSTDYFPVTWFRDLAEYPYEDASLPAPKDYDAVLGTIFGDYMTPPPPEKRGNQHQVMELDFGE